MLALSSLHAVGLSVRPRAGPAPPTMNAAAATLPFSKYHGLGNDFVLVDARSGDARCARARASLGNSILRLY